MERGPRRRINGKTEAAKADLDQKDATKRQAVHFLAVVAVDAADGSISANPCGLVTAAGADREAGGRRSDAGQWEEG